LNNLTNRQTELQTTISQLTHPELTKYKTESGDGKVDVSLCARSTMLSCKKREFVLSRDIWWLAAATTSGWLWPTRHSTA